MTSKLTSYLDREGEKLITVTTINATFIFSMNKEKRKEVNERKTKRRMGMHPLKPSVQNNKEATTPQCKKKFKYISSVLE